MGYAPYDGVLVSRGIVGGPAVGGKYSEAQAMRFRRVGARTFLRLDKPEFAHLPIFGDCGAFTYHKEDRPPYSPEDRQSAAQGKRVSVRVDLGRRRILTYKTRG